MTQLQTEQGIVKVPAGTWKVDPAHSSVGFEVKHMMISTVRGHFSSFDGRLEADEDPERALTMYITAKMQFSRQRPYGSRVWASEIMRGAPVMERFLGTTLKAWVNARVRTIRSWISAGKIRAVDPESLLYMIWAVTQHYADFERQIAILNGGDEFDERQYREKVEQVVRLILGSVGLEATETVRTRETASA